MENIVAVEVLLDSHERRFFLTWGRVHDPVDPEPIERAVLGNAHRFDLGGTPVRARLCVTLQEASGEPYFFEYLWDMARMPAPRGPAWDEWAKETADNINHGAELYYLGRIDWDKDSWRGTTREELGPMGAEGDTSSRPMLAAD